MTKMTQVEKAKAFAALHVKGKPVVLYNIWDSGSARALAGAGAKAIATGSASVAEAQGFEDGEKIPLEWVYGIASQIVANVDVPLSVDFEGAYGRDPATITKNVAGLIKAGAIGVNFEDQVVGGTGLYDVDEQVKRIGAVRQAGDDCDVPLFINARTDLFLQEADENRHMDLLPDAIARGRAYEKAGADCFFAPGLKDFGLIKALCESVSLPVNILTMGGTPDPSGLAALGVARISYGPAPFRALMDVLAQTYKQLG